MCTENIVAMLSKIMENITPNQNLICGAICYIGVVYADVKNIHCLRCITWVLFIASVISLLFSLYFYTMEYCARKWYKMEGHRADYVGKLKGDDKSECKNKQI